MDKKGPKGISLPKTLSLLFSLESNTTIKANIDPVKIARTGIIGPNHAPAAARSFRSPPPRPSFLNKNRPRKYINRGIPPPTSMPINESNGSIPPLRKERITPKIINGMVILS